MNKLQLQKFEEISKWLEDFPNIHLKSTIYTNAVDSLEWYCDLCPEQKSFPLSWTGMRDNKHKCPSCREKSRKENISAKILKWCKDNDVGIPEKRYNKQDDIMIWKCLRCGNTIPKTWNQIHNPNNCICPCRNETERRSNMLAYIRVRCKEFKLELQDKEYINDKKEMQWLCLLCGYNFPKSWNELSRERTVKCVKCRSKNTALQMEKARELAYRHRCKLLTKDEEYVDIKTYMKWQCEIHINEKPIERSMQLIETYDFICRSCHGGIDTKRLTLEQIEIHCQSVQVTLNGEFVYENNRQPLPVKCNLCNKPSNVTVRAMSQGTGCVDCGRKRACDWSRDSIESVLSIVMFRGGNIQEKNMVEYVNQRTKYLVDCGRGHSWHTNLNNLKGGNWCKYCVPHKLDIEEVREFLSKIGWILESKTYIDSSVPLKMKCSAGHTINKPFALIKNGRGCMECYNLRRGDDLRLSDERYHEAATIKGYICLKIPSNVHEHALWQCPKKHEWFTSYSNFVHNNTYCPECVRHQNESRTEKVLYNCLDELELFEGYEKQKKFPTLKNRALLSFDAYLVADGVEIAIEADGKQHYFQVKYWQDEDGFIRQHENDRIKEAYCEKNGIALIRIKYDIKTNEEIEKCIVYGIINAIKAAKNNEILIQRIVLPEISEKLVNSRFPSNPRQSKRTNLFEGDEDLLC